MIEFIAGIVIGFLFGVAAGVLFYRRHRDRIETAAEVARNM